MKRVLGSVRRAAHPFLCGVALLSALSLGLVLNGCSKKYGQSRPATAAGHPTEGDGSSSTGGELGNFLIAPDQQIRWGYESMPEPKPAKRPNYLLKSIAFPKGKSEFDAEARGVLRELATTLKAKPGITMLIVGHTDAGPEGVNAGNLALARAQAVRTFLSSQGVEKERMEFASFGAQYAKAANNEPIGQEQDRRAEIWLVEE